MAQAGQALIVALLVGFFGGLWAMYVRVLGHSEKIMNLQQDVSEMNGRLTGYSERQRVVEASVAAINAKLEQLPAMSAKMDKMLELQRGEPNHRIEGGN